MGNEKETLREEIERRRREIEELTRKEKGQDRERGTSFSEQPKMQAPELWPDPPEEK
uniref:Uncharacterized protein n=1 Tax=Candidatus Kentrum sp. FM TaxID=2126340 RepID=A0A450WSI2_9GAMM|nr:MAG: hypothetical protein BECKFM1743A_GA0114220_100278 [Candidatus Kentron sp. FM]VFJ49453.1 MAG: hypothetical protein BECKFM1743C_GA0114222_100718 [Candidatus Kentron sp. FM]VFK20005.1 MAG: hypothetical protein BECKFM1743B_GA0114221_106621 [Candidatus Kentron sp. FM]